jgi:predicted HTH domain antitoxin
MDMMILEVSMPRDLFAALGFSRKEAAEQLKEFTVLGLYQERRISAGKAAELLELSKLQFVKLLNRKGIAYFDQTEDELADELRAADEWQKKSGA